MIAFATESALLQRRYEAGLASYTYLTREGAADPRPLRTPTRRPAPLETEA